MKKTQAILGSGRILLAVLLAACGDGSPLTTDAGAPSGGDRDADLDAAPGYTATISAAGGTYELAQGITVVVPPNAVQQELTITITPLSAAQLQPILDARGLSADALLFSFDAKPDGQVFDVPLHVIAAVDLTPGNIPIVHEVDLAKGTFAIAATTVGVDPSAGTIDIALSHFSSYSAAQIDEFKRRGEEYCKINPCRCGAVESKQSDKDSICNNGDCVVLRSKLESTFFDCPGTPVETSTYTELNGKCVPQMALGPARAKIGKHDSTAVTAEVKLACDELPGETVTFEMVSGPAGAQVAPASAVTNDSGKAIATFSSGAEAGPAEVSAKTTVKYAAFTITATVGGVTETVSGPEKTASLAEETTVEIEDVERWVGTLDFDYDFVLPATVHDHATYKAELEFTLSNETWIVGTATATQAATVEPLGSTFTIANVDAPPTLDLVVDGGLDPDTNALYLELQKSPEAPFYTFDLCSASVGCTPQLGVDAMTVGLFLEDRGIVSLAEGTYQHSYTLAPVTTETQTFTYTLTLQRADGP